MTIFKNILSLYVLLNLIFFNSCTNESKHENVTTVMGKVKNPSYSKISLRYNEELIFSEIDSTGRFKFLIDSKTPLFMRLQLGERGLPIYSEPGNTDSIFCVEEFSKGLEFTGENRIVNKYLLTKILNYEIELRHLPKYYRMDAFTFKDKMDSLYSLFYSDFEILKRDTQLTEKFIELEKAQLIYKFARLKLSYLGGHKYFTKDDDAEPPHNYNTFIQELDLNNSNFLDSPEYISFLKKYLNQKSERYILDLQPDQQSEIYFQEVKMKLTPVLFSNKPIIEKLLLDLMTEAFKNPHSGEIADLFDLYNSTSNSTENKNKVSALYSKWMGLSPGMPAPEFSYKDVEGNQITLKDFKGNYIVLDIWATWCNPCKREIPLVAEMMEKYSDNNITIISISVDEDKTTWQKALEKFDLKGIQLFADNGWESTIIKDYNIHTIPRFILIDTTGNILNIDAPPPTRGLSNILEELL